MKKTAAIASFITALVEVLFVTTWTACHELKDMFYFSMFNVKLIVDDQIHNDTGQSMVVIRLFHNKLTTAFIEFFRHYLLFWDIRFLLPLLSPLGVFGLIAGFWYVLQKKMSQTYKIIIIFIVLAIPLLEMLVKLHVAFSIRIAIITLPVFVLSAFGIWSFLQKKSMIRYAIVIGLLLLSLWWFFIFRMEIFNFCVKA